MQFITQGISGREWANKWSLIICVGLEECIFHFLYSKLHLFVNFLQRDLWDPCFTHTFSVETCTFMNCCVVFSPIPKWCYITVYFIISKICKIKKKMFICFGISTENSYDVDECLGAPG